MLIRTFATILHSNGYRVYSKSLSNDKNLTLVGTSEKMFEAKSFVNIFATRRVTFDNMNLFIGRLRRKSNS